MRTRPLPTPTSAVPTAQPTAAAAVDAGHPQRWAILAVMCVSLVLIVAANSGLNVALPTLVRQLGATQTQLQWIVDAYALVFAGLVLPAGALGDRFGRKQALQVGVAVFAAGAVAAPLAAAITAAIAAAAIHRVGPTRHDTRDRHHQQGAPR
ncbi:MAG: MFS transporter [Actinobacteria bacterium]|nr:MFS transporter [Actinomycetota bacterium]